MRYLVLAAIRAYWHLVPARHRRLCLFRESCSRFVHRATVEGGALAGAKALWLRAHQCTSGYHIRMSGDGMEIVCRGGNVIRAPDVNAELFSHLSMRLAARDSRIPIDSLG